MTPQSHLEELATTRNWVTLGKALSAARDDPARFGFDDGSHMLAHVAQLRGVDPSSLRNPLAAVNWMKQNAPKALEAEDSTVPMTGVLTLSQISIVSSALAAQLAPKFFSGEVSRRQLQIALRRAEADQGGRGVAAHERAKRVSAHEERVFSFLRAQPEVLELGQDVEIAHTRRDALVPSDFTATCGGQVVAAIECKSHRSKLHRRYLVETLAMSALLAKEYNKAILVVPGSWGSSAGDLERLRKNLSLHNVLIGVFENSTNRKDCLTIAGS